MTDTKDEPKVAAWLSKETPSKATPAAKKAEAKPKPAPKKAKKAAKKAKSVSQWERDEKELSKIREANEEKRLRQFGPAEVHEKVPAGDKERFVEVHAFGGVVYVNSHGEAKLDRVQALHLVQTLQAAFQAVS